MFQPRAATGVLLALAAVAVAENGDPCQDLLGAGGFLQFAAANGIVAAEDCKVSYINDFIICALACPPPPPPHIFPLLHGIAACIGRRLSCVRACSRP